MTPPAFTFSLVLRSSQSVSLPDAGLSNERTFSVLPPPVPVGRAVVSYSGEQHLQKAYLPQRARTYEVLSTLPSLADLPLDGNLLPLTEQPAFAYVAQLTPFFTHTFAARSLTLSMFGAYSDSTDVLVVTTLPDHVHRYVDAGWWTYPFPDTPNCDVSLNVRRLCKRWSDWSHRYTSSQRFEILGRRLLTHTTHLTLESNDRSDRPFGTAQPCTE